MNISVRYHTPLRWARGLANESVTLPTDASLVAALKHLAENNPSALRGMLLGPEGEISPHLVVFRNDSLAAAERNAVTLNDGDELRLFLAVSGGHDWDRAGACGRKQKESGVDLRAEGDGETRNTRSSG
jgi:molybdopterin converting factor small subunit